MTNDEPRAKALAEFTLYFVENYPGPHTIITDPKWHAPKIFKAAERSFEAALDAYVQEKVALARLEGRIEQQEYNNAKYYIPAEGPTLSRLREELAANRAKVNP